MAVTFPMEGKKEHILFTLATAAEVFFSSSPPTDILCRWMSIAISQTAHGDNVAVFQFDFKDTAHWNKDTQYCWYTTMEHYGVSFG